MNDHNQNTMPTLTSGASSPAPLAPSLAAAGDGAGGSAGGATAASHKSTNTVIIAGETSPSLLSQQQPNNTSQPAANASQPANTASASNNASSAPASKPTSPEGAEQEGIDINAAIASILNNDRDNFDAEWNFDDDDTTTKTTTRREGFQT